MNSNNFLKGLVGVVLGLIIIVAIVVLATVLIIKNTTETMLAPVDQASQYLATQSALLFNPTPTVVPDPVTIIHDIRSLARLETVQYTLEKLITAESGQGSLGFLFGDKLLFVAHGTVVAGVDLAKLSADDLWLTGGVLNVRLPAAEVFSATLDNKLSYVYDRETGLLTRGQVELETLARQSAEDEIKQAALDDGILSTADQNARAYLTSLFLGLGFPDVVFVDQ